MRRREAIAAVLLSLCLLLTGCGLFDWEVTDTETYADDDEGYTLFTRADTSAADLNPGQIQKNPVKTVLAYSGVCEFMYPTMEYSYELPFIDLGGSYAAGCNEELERRFGDAIRESLSRMEQIQEPIVQTVSYYSYIYGAVLTLRVERIDVDGSRSSGIYTVNADTGERVTPEEFCAASGLPRDMLKSSLERAVEERLAVEKGGEDKDSQAFRTALTNSLAQLANENTLNFYLESNGALMCVVQLWLPAGGTATEAVRIS